MRSPQGQQDAYLDSEPHSFGGTQDPNIFATVDRPTPVPAHRLFFPGRSSPGQTAPLMYVSPRPRAWVKEQPVGRVDRACKCWLGGHTHACKVPHSQRIWPMIRGTQSAALVLKSNTLWVKFQRCHLPALYPKTSCHCTVVVSCTGFVSSPGKW